MTTLRPPHAPRDVHLRAILGPTNTGKTHVALETCGDHASAVLGFPLRLLAREAYDRLCARFGPDATALVTGEEKRIGKHARYFCCTTEAMPEEVLGEPFSLVVIDEVQLCADPERGHLFTDRVLHRRGTRETLWLGADTAAPVLLRLFPSLVIERRPRLSQLTHIGHKRLARLPKRSAIVAFSMAEVYRIAEEVRTHHGGCAVVLGALSPRTRNAQVDMFQNGDVDVLVATDAIGMGLNLDVQHVAFASTRKFDGDDWRSLTPAELAQIAGRAGRHMKNGTFGHTDQAQGLTPDEIDAVTHHRFAPLATFCWRNSDLDFSSTGALIDSLRQRPERAELVHGRVAIDLLALERLAHNPDCADLDAEDTERLWRVCQVPDFHKWSPDAHAELLLDIFSAWRGHDVLPDAWFVPRVRELERADDGDVETLLTRMSHVRTLSYVAHQRDFGADARWGEQMLALEDRLSDRLHAALQMRFVDRLGRAVHTGRGLQAAIDEEGRVDVSGESLGHVVGLRFVPEHVDNKGNSRQAWRALAAHKALTPMLTQRAHEVMAAPVNAFSADFATGHMLWQGEAVGLLQKGPDVWHPRVEALWHDVTGQNDAQLRQQLRTALTDRVQEMLARAFAWRTALTHADLPGAARGVRHQLEQGLGVVSRATLDDTLGRLSPEERHALTRRHVRLGFRHVFVEGAFQAAAVGFRVLLLALFRGQPPPTPAPAGASSFDAGERPVAVMSDAGFVVAGDRCFRADLVDKVLVELLAHGADFALPASACERLGASRAQVTALLLQLGFKERDGRFLRGGRRRH